jgi:serine/threonine-protein kinase HipA
MGLKPDTWLQIEMSVTKPITAEDIIRDMHRQVENWPTFADRAGVADKPAQSIHRAMRREIIIPS